MPAIGGFLGNMLQPKQAAGAPAVRKTEGGLPNPKDFEAQYPNLRILDALDLITLESGNPTAMKANIFNELGSFSVPAQTVMRVGYGMPGAGYEGNQGRLYALLKNAAGTTQNGKIRFFATNFRTTTSVFYRELSTELLATTNIFDRASQVPYPELEPPIYRDSKIGLGFQPKTAFVNGNISSTTSSMSVPVTEYL